LSVAQLNDWQSRFGDKIDFVCVYIAEAHANDVWPLGRHVDIHDHRNFAERVAASQILLNKFDFKIPLLYDTMDNLFDKEYAVWPERYYLVFNNELLLNYEPQITFGFDRKRMEDDLQSCYINFDKFMRNHSNYYPKKIRNDLTLVATELQ